MFDLDGVITPTALVHMQAWAEMFGELLSAYPDQRPYADADYFAHIDGKPRYDGVRDFLASRGIELPEGAPSDPITAQTVCGLGNRKDALFNAVLERDGVAPYPGSVVLLDALQAQGVPMAVVSSSRNAPAVLDVAGVAHYFTTVVSGAVAGELGLAGKPAPDTFVHAAEVLGATAATSVVLEDATSGVAAGRAGNFGLVIGVDRGAGVQALTQAGADLVVADLQELVR
ncbi:beta-phosphoglucomutase family hydrolase [Nocardioides montaniterrae]